MDSERPPRTWIGEEVSIYFVGDRTDDDEVADHMFVLRNIVPEGVVAERSVTIEKDGRTYEGKVDTLFPWHQISYVAKFLEVDEIDAEAEGAE